MFFYFGTPMFDACKKLAKIYFYVLGFVMK